jgi:hypothetical protein
MEHLVDCRKLPTTVFRRMTELEKSRFFVTNLFSIQMRETVLFRDDQKNLKS